MKEKNKYRYPPYLPPLLKFLLILRKFYRQSRTRIDEHKARKEGPKGIIPDGDGIWPKGSLKDIKSPKDAINKCAVWLNEDMEEEKVKSVSDKIRDVAYGLNKKGLFFCSPAGTFVPYEHIERRERRKLWENAWVISHSDISPGQKILDVGGASTIFSFYLASLGCEVRIIDNDWGNCGANFNTNYVAKRMKWDLKAIDRDAAQKLPFSDNYFDRVFSICVLEHLPSFVRRLAMKEMARVLKPGGLLGLTVDYDHRRPVLTTDKGLRFAYIKKLEEDVIKPSGLQIHGNTDLVDAYKEKEIFLASLFLKKP